MPNSIPSNFGFLKVHDAQLVRFGMLAEKYFADDPNTRVLAASSCRRIRR
jgi:type I restriction enzyme R subunit